MLQAHVFLLFFFLKILLEKYTHKKKNQNTKFIHQTIQKWLEHSIEILTLGGGVGGQKVDHKNNFIKTMPFFKEGRNLKKLERLFVVVVFLLSYSRSSN